MASAFASHAVSTKRGVLGAHTQARGAQLFHGVQSDVKHLNGASRSASRSSRTGKIICSVGSVVEEESVFHETCSMSEVGFVALRQQARVHWRMEQA